MTDRWVRIMADYCADGMWDRDGAGGFAPDVPISTALRARIGEWCATYDKTDLYLPVEMRKVPFDMEAFCAEGLAIARAVKSELPDWTVVYFDEAKCPKRWQVGTDRSVFEYEVTASP